MQKIYQLTHTEVTLNYFKDTQAGFITKKQIL